MGVHAVLIWIGAQLSPEPCAQADTLETQSQPCPLSCSQSLPLPVFHEKQPHRMQVTRLSYLVLICGDPELYSLQTPGGYRQLLFLQMLPLQTNHTMSLPLPFQLFLFFLLFMLWLLSAFAFFQRGVPPPPP